MLHADQTVQILIGNVETFISSVYTYTIDVQNENFDNAGEIYP